MFYIGIDLMDLSIRCSICLNLQIAYLGFSSINVSMVSVEYRLTLEPFEDPEIGVLYRDGFDGPLI